MESWLMNNGMKMTENFADSDDGHILLYDPPTIKHKKSTVLFALKGWFLLL